MKKFKNIRFLFFILIFNLLSIYYLKMFYKNSGILKFLKIPKISLPNNILLIIFIILYFMIIFGMFLNYRKGGKNLIYFTFIIIKILWGYLFLVERLYGLSFLLVIVLIILCTYMGIKFLKISKISSLIMFLYSAWLTYFCILNFFVWVYNEM